MMFDIMDIAGLIDVEPLISIMRNFHDFSKIPQGIFDRNHRIICEFGTQSICEIFHRKSNHSTRFCLQKIESLEFESDDRDYYSACQCANGLMTYMVPIMVKGELVAVAYLGQFLTEKPDMEFFRGQAQRYGFDSHDYLKAVSEVPIVAKDVAERAARFLSVFSKVLSTSAAAILNNLENEENAKKKEARRTALMESLLMMSNMEAKVQDDAIKGITELTAKALDVDYVSFCRQSSENKNDLYTYRYIRAESFHEQFLIKDDIPQHPTYFQALEDGLIVVAPDAVADERTREYNEHHHVPLGIVSTIEVPTKLMGRSTGVLSIEHTWEKRQWTQDELYFSMIAERILSMSLDWFERQRLEEARSILEENLLQSRKMDALGVLAGGIAHDFNNILGVILGYAELAIKTLPDGPMVNEYLLEICKSSVLAKKTIEKVLAFSRKCENMRAAVRIDKAFNEMLRYLGNALPEKITMHFSSNVKGVRVYIDPYQLHQMTLNLVQNAIYSMKGTGGCIKMVLDRMIVASGSRYAKIGVPIGEYMHFTVEDEGAGIPPEIISRIFEPYFTTKPPSEGTGMGLAMVHGIVKSAGGFVEALNNLVRGTKMVVLLPIFEDSGTDETTTNIVAGLKSEIPMFDGFAVCIDDDIKMAQITGRMLKLMGFDCEIYDNPMDMLDAFALSEKTVDFVVIDYHMQGMNGLELAGRIKNLYPETEAILMTMAGDVVEHDDLSAHGISIILEKPLRFADMVQVIGLLQKEREQNGTR